MVVKSTSRKGKLTRRSVLRTAIGTLGLSLPTFLRARFQAQASAATRHQGPAKSCIVLYCWGGMSHHETWDPKPHAPAEIRGEFSAIPTAVPGIQIGEHMPLLARQTHRLAIIRSMHHDSSAHGKGMYWNLTGHAPPQAATAVNLPPSRHDWPALPAMISKFCQPPRGIPRAVRLPYPLVDNGTLQAGEYGGWLGVGLDPIVMRTPGGTEYGGVSRSLGSAVLKLSEDLDTTRLAARQALLGRLDLPLGSGSDFVTHDHFRQLASDMLMTSSVKKAYALEKENARVRESYGGHICGRSMLLARRLTEAGVPIVTVCCAAGDLNGSVGDHWDTHGDNFNRLKNTMLPVFDRAAAALLNDLGERGSLDDTLVVFLTEFGRTPRVNSAAGRDHYPDVYSVALAGGGIRGGQVYGSSDKHGALPAANACGPADLHATIFHALGISPHATIHDLLGRPFPVSDGKVLPLS